MYLSYWITTESRKVPSPLMRSRQSNENISDATPVASPKKKTKTNNPPQNLRASSSKDLRMARVIKDQPSLALFPTVAKIRRLKLNLRKSNCVNTFLIPIFKNVQLRDFLSKKLYLSIEQSLMDP